MSRMINTNLQGNSSESAGNPVEASVLPFNVKRVFYIYGIPRNASRGGHSHRKTRLAIFCLTGECKMFLVRGNREETFTLCAQAGGVLVEPGEWHRLFDFVDDTVVLVLSSRLYEPDDYIYRYC